MRIVWLIIGILIAVGIFLFWPGAWSAIIHYAKMLIDFILKWAGSWAGANTTSNITGR